METKPSKPFSKLNQTELKALFASSNSAAEKAKISNRLEQLSRKPIKHGFKTNPDVSATHLLRQYYAKTFGEGNIPVQVNKDEIIKIEETEPITPIEIEMKNHFSNRKKLLEVIDDEYEILEINLKLGRKI